MSAKFVIFLFAIFNLWWLYLHLFNSNLDQKQIFSALYGVVALVGAIYGINISLKWGGFKSLMGKSIMMFSLGLIAQEFGQLVYSAYNFFFHIVVPYPSLGDIGYFGSIPLYILGAYYLAKVSGAGTSIKSTKSKIIILLITLVLLVSSYMFFLKGYEFSETPLLTIFLDFGYPFGQAIYVSIALVAYVLSRQILGGIMRNKVLFILFALVVQYFSDFAFLYISRYGEMGPGEIVDLMYLVSYFLMVMALLRLNTVFDELTNKSVK